MGRKIRYLPEPGQLVEITCSVIHRRFLLLPSAQLEAVIIGTPARLQKRYQMKVCGFVYLSNHAHLLLRPDNVKQLAERQTGRQRTALEAAEWKKQGPDAPRRRRFEQPEEYVVGEDRIFGQVETPLRQEHDVLPIDRRAQVGRPGTHLGARPSERWCAAPCHHRASAPPPPPPRTTAGEALGPE